MSGLFTGEDPLFTLKHAQGRRFVLQMALLGVMLGMVGWILRVQHRAEVEKFHATQRKDRDLGHLVPVEEP